MLEKPSAEKKEQTQTSSNLRAAAGRLIRGAGSPTGPLHPPPQDHIACCLPWPRAWHIDDAHHSLLKSRTCELQSPSAHYAQCKSSEYGTK